MNDREDRALLARVAEGDTEAFGALMARFSDPLYAFMVRMVRRPAIAEELLQETFVRAWRAAPRYRPVATVSTWLFCVAHRLTLNEMARACHVREVPTEVPEAFAAEGSVDALAALEQKRRLVQVERALDALPARQRAAVVLARVQGMSYREVAAVMEVSERAVESLLRRGEQALTARLRTIL